MHIGWKLVLTGLIAIVIATAGVGLFKDESADGPGPIAVIVLLLAGIATIVTGLLFRIWS